MVRIRNVHIRGTTQVGCFEGKVSEAKLRWLVHVQRKENIYSMFNVINQSHEIN